MSGLTPLLPLSGYSRGQQTKSSSKEKKGVADKFSNFTWKGVQAGTKAIPMALAGYTGIKLIQDIIAAIFDGKFKDTTTNEMQKGIAQSRQLSHLASGTFGAAFSVIEAFIAIKFSPLVSIPVCAVFALAYNFIRDSLGLNTAKVAYLASDDENEDKTKSAKKTEPTETPTEKVDTPAQETKTAVSPLANKEIGNSKNSKTDDGSGDDGNNNGKGAMGNNPKGVMSASPGSIPFTVNIDTRPYYGAPYYGAAPTTVHNVK